MMTVHEVSRISGVSIRTLHHYDSIGLLRPTQLTEACYRLYDDTALERLQQILLFRELEFPLKEIKKILDSPNFDRQQALAQQITMLELRREQLDNLISHARGLQENGVKNMSFEAFDKKKLDEYAAEAKKQWGHTDAYREFEQKQAGLNDSEQEDRNAALMDIFRRFGEIRHLNPSDCKAVALATELQAFITEHFYRCTDDILQGLGSMYEAGGEFTENIDRAGGEGTARFAAAAIRAKTAK